MLKLMSVKDYAKKMACAESTIRKMCAPGGILFAVSDKIGVGYKIDAEAADEIFRERMAKKLPALQRPKRKPCSDFLAEIAARQRELKEVM